MERDPKFYYTFGFWLWHCPAAEANTPYIVMTHSIWSYDYPLQRPNLYHNLLANHFIFYIYCYNNGWTKFNNHLPGIVTHPHPFHPQLPLRKVNNLFSSVSLSSTTSFLPIILPPAILHTLPRLNHTFTTEYVRRYTVFRHIIVSGLCMRLGIGNQFIARSYFTISQACNPIPPFSQFLGYRV